MPSERAAAASTGRRLVSGSRAARRHLAVTGVLGAASALLIVAQAALLAYVVNAVFMNGADLGEVSTALLALIAIAGGRTLAVAGFEYSGRRGAQRAMTELRLGMLQRLLDDCPASLADERSGELAATAVNGVDALESYFARYLPQAALATLVPFAILVYVAGVDVESAILLAVTAPLIPVFMVLIGRASEHSARKRWQTLSLLSAHFLDVVYGLPTLRAHNRANAQVGGIATAGERFKDETMRTLRIAFLSALVMELLAMMGTALVAATVGVQLVAGSLEFEHGLAVLLMAPELYQPFRQLGAQFHASAEGVTAAERIFEVIDRKPDVPATRATSTAPNPAVTPIEFCSVVYEYPGGRGQALIDVSFTIAPREHVALVGPSGAGKTTIAKLLLRLADPAAGAIECGGVDLRNVNAHEWRRLVAWVPQRPYIFAATLRENVLLANPDCPGDLLDQALERAALANVVCGLPDGVDTRIGEGGRPLSLGEAQRIGLARAFVRDCPLAILDEPTAYLDQTTAESVSRSIAEYGVGRSLLLITHDPARVAPPNRILYCELGHVLSEPSNNMQTAPGETLPA